MFGGVAGGDHAELGGALGGGRGAGGHVLEGIEADDLGHLGEADARMTGWGSGKRADGSDSGDAVEERVAEVVDGTADGGDAA